MGVATHYDGRRTQMRELAANILLTLDAVMQATGGRDEGPSGGFARARSQRSGEQDDQDDDGDDQSDNSDRASVQHRRLQG